MIAITETKPPVCAQAWIRFLSDPASCAYHEDNKAAFLRHGRTIAKAIAKQLGLHPSQYTIRVNPGGIAVGGDVHLHTDVFEARLNEFETHPIGLYVDLGSSRLGPRFMARACAGRQDYTGAVNQWFAADSVLNLPALCDRLIRMPRGPYPPDTNE